MLRRAFSRLPVRRAALGMRAMGPIVRTMASRPDLSEYPRDAMDYDVVIVGAGPAGLSSAIRLKQLCAEHDTDLSVCVLEKGATVGAHILSGNVFEPRALNELLPDWKERGAPIDTPAGDDHFHILTEKGGFKMPFVPPMLHNHGNYVISLGKVCQWLGEQAEELGVEIFPGFPASEVLYNDEGGVIGVATADQGIAKDGTVKDSFQRGMELRAKQTIFAEGCRGSCSEEVIEKFGLRDGKDPQIYGLGLKEVWRVDKERHRPGFIQHTVGWPVPNDVYAGTFLYHMEPDLVLVGMVVGLDYANPYLNPYREFQRVKHHPVIRQHIEGGECIQYGARCVNEGGFQSIPRVSFPGGALVGCSAGFLNVPKIKGTHTAMKSAMLAAESIFEGFQSGSVEEGAAYQPASYQTALEGSWVWEEMKSVRNYHPSFKYGLFGGLAYSGLSAYVLRGKEPWTFHHPHEDHEMTKPARECTPIEYPKPDGKLSFDLLTNLTRSGTNHVEDQPAHLRIKEGMEDVPAQVSYQEYAGPEQRFCPANVYEYPEEGKLQINAQNCVHCKCCSIKMPRKYINWTVPEAGGGGPAYEIM